MGADIHIFIEYKVGDKPWAPDAGHEKFVEDEDYWYVNSAHGGRDYELFAALAGVRGDGPEPRGRPDDISDLIDQELERGGSDYHSESYYYLDEFEKIVRSVGHYKRKKKGSIKPNAFGDWQDSSYLSVIEHCKEQVRKMKTDLEFEKQLLGQKGINTEVLCRIVFAFDN